MSDDKPRPALTTQGEADRLARQAREAAALRDNLRRRKAQVRARAQSSDAAIDQPDDSPIESG